jgi:hypothetical protein
MGVAGEIGEHRLGPGEGRLGVDEPLLPPEWREARGECLLATQTLDLAEERQPTGRVGVGDELSGAIAGVAMGLRRIPR